MQANFGWRLDSAVTFLNHGSYGACPEPVLAVRAARRGREPEQVLIRISAQRYNEPSDYERLADALVRRLGRG